MIPLHAPHVRRSTWQVTLTSPESGQHWRYTIPAHHLHQTLDDIRTLVRRLHGIVAHGHSSCSATHEVITDVVFTPSTVCRRRAVDWVALRELRSSLNESWAHDFPDRRQAIEDRTIAFGVSLREVMAAAALRGAGWDLAPYRDRFGRVNWEVVRADIRHGAMSVLHQTPHGLLWVDHG
ncbi:hypothetical protein [Streptomyces sp. NPDC047968]|uniref:hypothetical protein n=1 Tax=unclassified Streptomyces TaxID=2593676 RepID=UPI0034445EC1